MILLLKTLHYPKHEPQIRKLLYVYIFPTLDVKVIMNKLFIFFFPSFTYVALVLALY